MLGIKMQFSVVFIAAFIGLKLSIAEGQACDNLALRHKSVKQSTNYEDRSVAHLAVDGTITGIYMDAVGVFCTATKPFDNYPWWEVTLSKTARIKYIRITNRLDAVPEYLRDLKITAGVGSATTLCATFARHSDQNTLQYTIACANSIVADTVKIEKIIATNAPNHDNHDNILTLCEVEIFTCLG